MASNVYHGHDEASDRLSRHQWVGYVVLVGAPSALTITATPMGRVCSEASDRNRL